MGLEPLFPALATLLGGLLVAGFGSMAKNFWAMLIGFGCAFIGVLLLIKGVNIQMDQLLGTANNSWR